MVKFYLKDYKALFFIDQIKKSVPWFKWDLFSEDIKFHNLIKINETIESYNNVLR